MSLLRHLIALLPVVGNPPRIYTARVYDLRPGEYIWGYVYTLDMQVPVRSYYRYVSTVQYDRTVRIVPVVPVPYRYSMYRL